MGVGVQVIPFRISDDRYNVFIALEEKNLARMKGYDPAQFRSSLLPREWQAYTLDTVLIGYATEKDLAQVRFLIESGAPAAALEFLSRGFEFDPKQGDSDKPYEHAP